MSHPPGEGKIERRDREGRGIPPISPLYLPAVFLVLFVSLAVTVWTLRPRRAAPDLSAYPWLYLRDGGPLATREGAAHRIGFACEASPEGDDQTFHPVDVPQTSKPGLFCAGAIDLTGDGVPEPVRRERDQVVIYGDGTETWRGLPEWRVVDLALGDPNDDGRGELLLALWKPDVEGVPRSHPFIVGYRQGAYRILWGGSAVADPICEVELGDVDGDGVQELIVLEERRGDDCAVTVWRWHGWGFTLMWRSPPGRYGDLVLIPGEAGGPPIISVAIRP
jgi:hypothetical protein